MRYQSQSKVLRKGYINLYSPLNVKQRRQLYFKTLYKHDSGSKWDETQVYLSKAFKSLCQNNITVLDAGCGNGNYVIDENHQKISSAIGLDVAPEYTQKNICLDKIYFGNLEQMPFADNSFNSVISLWVLEHVKNPRRVFSEIHRVLKPGGLFFFATPNSDYLPLKIIHFLKSSKLNHFLNQFLFGRKSEEVFPTYYRANTINDIQKHLGNLFDIEKLFLNPDVSYTSFNHLTYLFSKMMLSLPFLSLRFTSAHVVGILRKKF